MKNIKESKSLILGGIVFTYIGVDLINFWEPSPISHLVLFSWIAFLLSILYFFSALFSKNEYLRIFLKYGFFAILGAFMVSFDSFYSYTGGLSQRSWWHSSGSVCTEGTNCWLWGHAVLILAVVWTSVIGVAHIYRRHKEINGLKEIKS